MNRTDTDSLYDVACYRAVAAALQAMKPGPDAARLAEDDADKAMEWLHKAVQAGWNNLALLKSDTYIDPLRERQDFKKLLAVLEKKAEKK